jgi:hypothetical protein
MVPVVPYITLVTSIRSSGWPLSSKRRTMWSPYKSCARQKFIMGTSDGRGSPE